MASFDSEHRAFAYVFAGLVTLATFPIVGWHFWLTLTGLALAAIAGLAICDIVLWFASHWSVKVQSAALRAVALIVKFALSLVMVVNAGIVVFLMRGDSQTEALVRQQTEARRVEIQARADAAKELAQTPGGRSAARETMRISDGPNVQAIASTTRAQLEEYVPAWYLNVGLYVTPPIAAILGFMALTVCASIIKRRERSAELEVSQEDIIRLDPLPRQASSLPAQSSPSIPVYGQDKPRAVWRGGVRVDPGGNVRPS